MIAITRSNKTGRQSKRRFWMKPHSNFFQCSFPEQRTAIRWKVQPEAGQAQLAFTILIAFDQMKKRVGRNVDSNYAGRATPRPACRSTSRRPFGHNQDEQCCLWFHGWSALGPYKAWFLYKGWYVKIKRDDVYIMSGSGKFHKISLHGSGVCHSAVPQDEIVRLGVTAVLDEAS